MKGDGFVRAVRGRALGDTLSELPLATFLVSEEQRGGRVCARGRVGTGLFLRDEMTDSCDSFGSNEMFIGPTGRKTTDSFVNLFGSDEIVFFCFFVVVSCVVGTRPQQVFHGLDEAHVHELVEAWKVRFHWI